MNPLSESTYLVLLALYHEPLHGYGIIKSIEDVSGSTFIIAPGTLYGVLNNLQKQKLIETVKEETFSRKKKTYCITAKGKDILQAEFKRFQSMVQFTEKIMGK
ncbi:PadR family transcriptional regulator [Priestia taiwanensis]|uniref:PadR family transcriptional regulator n=1 Tax=Priestia taiwanensis TaxID=1347902 RepID=A0A917EQJ7_9BACI|nr:PadR family transcriptional regulator [Priestia taiwanensis]MBM7364140.1 DNA-binding PadR family transcriptional regulator [Priestia taiwanensis]GGE71885.1 PadR family transcriptional regulator [Priestia taiwanensis]